MIKFLEKFKETLILSTLDKNLISQKSGLSTFGF